MHTCAYVSSELVNETMHFLAENWISYCFYCKMENKYNPAHQMDQNPLDLF